MSHIPLMRFPQLTSNIDIKNYGPVTIQEMRLTFATESINIKTVKGTTRNICSTLLGKENEVHK